MWQQTPWWVLGIPAVLALTHYWGIHSSRALRDHKEAVRSFAGGFSIGYVFLFLLKEIPTLALAFEADPLVVMLLGFTLFHAAHRFVFQPRGRLFSRRVWLDEIHLVTSVMYTFLLSFTVVELALVDPVKGSLFGLVIALHLGLIEISHRKPVGAAGSMQLPALVVFTLLGGLLPLIDWLDLAATVWIFAFTAGAVIYTAIREELPSDGEGRPVWFVLGALLFTVVTKLLF